MFFSRCINYTIRGCKVKTINSKALKIYGFYRTKYIPEEITINCQKQTKHSIR